MINPMVIYCQILGASLLRLCQRHYWRDWYRLFSATLYAYNGIYLRYSMMVLIMLSLVKCWFTAKSLVLHCFAYIRAITQGIDINSVEPYVRYTGPPIHCRNNTFSDFILCYAWMIDYTIISKKSEYNTWHRWYIEILTSYPDSTSKMGPVYVKCRYGLIPSNFGDTDDILKFWCTSMILHTMPPDLH
jgi:hypothetical protein